MAIGILADTRKGIVIKSEHTNLDLIALIWEMRDLVKRINTVDRQDDPVQLRVIRKLMDLEAEPGIPLQDREKIGRVRQLAEMALANDYLDDEYREKLEETMERAGEILRRGNRALEELLAERRRAKGVGRKA